MIWESTFVMTAMDLTVMIVVAVLLRGAARRREVIRRAGATPAAVFALAGLVGLLAFHLVDLFGLWVLPVLSTPVRAATVMDDLHMNWAWMVHYGAFIAIMSGGILLARRVFSLVQRSEDLARERDEELLARGRSVVELEESRRELRETQHMARLGSWRYDLEAGTWIASPELLQILHFPEPRESLRAADLLRILRREELERLGQVVASALAGEGRLEVDLELRPGGLPQFVRVLGEVVHAVDGRVVGMVGMAQDVTQSALAANELVRLNEELEDRVHERTAQLEDFAVTVSHDLKAPLRVIQGFVDAAIDDYEEQLDGEGVAYLRRIQGAAARLHLLIDRLLAYSRLGHVEVEPMPVDLDTVLKRMAADLESDLSARGGDLSVEHPLARVMGQRDIVTQIVGNLLNNAVKFVDEETPPRVRVWTEDGGDQVRLWVEDNGIGLRPADHDRIFRVFERLHGEESFPGSGMGLAIVDRAVKRMQGRVGVESTTGRGSRFWVELPRAG